MFGYEKSPSGQPPTTVRKEHTSQTKLPRETKKPSPPRKNRTRRVVERQLPPVETSSATVPHIPTVSKHPPEVEALQPNLRDEHITELSYDQIVPEVPSINRSRTIDTDPFAYSGNNSSPFFDEVSKARKNLFQLEVNDSWTSEDQNFLWDPNY